jgi:acetyltransferase-like isoleucine patch superfamily enzyme
LDASGLAVIQLTLRQTRFEIMSGELKSGQYAAELGPRSQVEEPAMLGRRYRGWKQPLLIGSDAIVRPYSVIYCDTEIGHHFQCGYFVLIRAECRLGDRVTLMSRVTLEGRIKLGSGTKIMANVYIPSRTSIGSMVFVGPNTTLLNDRLPIRMPAEAMVVKGPTIEDNVSIGGGCTILPGVTVGKGAFIGGGSVVTRDVPPWTLAYGVPARHYEMPESLRGGNRPEFMFPQVDLWGPHEDPSWSDSP